MTLLERINRERQQGQELLRQRTANELRTALCELGVAGPVFIFGSVIKPGEFTEASDLDLAVEIEQPGLSICQMTSLLAERLGRRVDVLLLSECRFAAKIVKEGERWMPQG